MAVVGGGPAGLAAATELAKLGVANIVVLEREAQAGGVPRHCGHSPFGMREFGRCYRGARYANHLVALAQNAGVDVRVNTTVVSAAAGGKLTLATAHGARRLEARRVVLSTGARETPRAARLVSGSRPLGVLTTGALQAMVYLQKKIPFTRPLIVGSELVALSALLTCRHAAIKPVALLEADNRLTAWRGAGLLPRLLGVPVRLETEVVEILGAARVSGVRVANAAGATETLRCDGLVFTGQFTPESALMRGGHIAVDARSGGPVIDQFGRCSDPAYFATGNLLRPVETAGWCRREGAQTARCVSLSLAGRLPDGEPRIPLTVADPVIKYVVPQTLAMPAPTQQADVNGMKHLQLRFAQPATGRLSLHSESAEMHSQSVRALPERRVLLALSERLQASQPATLKIHFAPRSA